jgi:hypothetical protein
MIRTLAPVTETTARACTIPTDTPEADGTFAWTSTTTASEHRPHAASCSKPAGPLSLRPMLTKEPGP